MSAPRRAPARGAAPALSLVLLVLVGCGDEDESTPLPPATGEGAGAAATAPGTAAVAGSTAPAVTASVATDVAVASPATAPSTTGTGNCSVTITGDVSADWTSDATGPQAFVYGGWLTDPGPEDAGAFAANCFDRDFNIVGFLASAGTEIPMEPATYDAGAPSDPGNQMTAEVALISDDGLWDTTSGTLELVEFDDAHIRGRFALTIQDSFDTARTAEVSGEFTHTR